jgi:hypothetical protein
LECQRTVLESPEEILAISRQESTGTRWIFKGYSAASLTELFSKLDLGGMAKAELLSSNKWKFNGADIEVQPSDRTVLSLSPNVRKQLYSVLGEFEENRAQSHPFLWPAGAQEDLLAGAHLSPQARLLFENLCYRNREEILFADQGAALRALSQESDKLALAKVLSRHFVLFGSLKLSSRSDISTLLTYWGKGGYARDIRPLIEAAARSPEEMKISLINLLPPSVRADAYRFPLAKPGPKADSFWTAFNFFEDPPGPIIEDGAVWKRLLETDYVASDSAPSYGDIVLLAREGGGIIHACVYLADDMVYTKNGGSPSAPWELAKLGDLIESFSWNLPAKERLSARYFRQKKFLRETGPNN